MNTDKNSRFHRRSSVLLSINLLFPGDELLMQPLG
jgi:hypothetical protein